MANATPVHQNKDKEQPRKQAPTKARKVDAWSPAQPNEPDTFTMPDGTVVKQN